MVYCCSLGKEAGVSGVPTDREREPIACVSREVATISYEVGGAARTPAHAHACKGTREEKTTV